MVIPHKVLISLFLSPQWDGLKQAKPLHRSGAQGGDLIVVSGTVGDAAALQHLGHSLQQRLDYPTPRCELGHLLKEVSPQHD